MQKAKLQKYADDHDYAVIAQYVDEGISAKDIKHRPAMRQLLADAASGEIDIVIFWKLTRIVRSVRDLCLMHDLLDANGVLFVSMTEAFDTVTPAGRLMLYILGAIAQFERELISENVRAAMEHRAKQGLRMCGSILGYDIVIGGSLTVNPAEAAIVRWIFDQYLSCGSFSAVARFAAERGFRGKFGRELRAGNIRMMLKSTVYAGYFSFRGIAYKGDYPPIISPKTHNKVLRMMDSSKFGRGRKKPLIWLPEG